MKSSIVLLISSILSSSPVISASTSRNRRFRNNGVSSPAELPEPLSATSALGQKLLSKARRLEDEQDNNDNNAQTWVVGYSLKFLGCHAISQYNSEAEENDVLIKKKRLVRFRLCPTSSCMSTSLIGCATGYGDYVIDMNEYMYGYWEYKQQQKEYNCYMYGLNSCGCTEQDDDGDDQQAQDADEVEDFNEEQCLYQCFINAGKNECTAYIDYEVEENDDGQEKEIEQIDVSDYMRCAQIEFDEKDDDEEGRRGLEEEEEEEEYEDEELYYSENVEQQYYEQVDELPAQFENKIQLCSHNNEEQQTEEHPQLDAKMTNLMALSRTKNLDTRTTGMRNLFAFTPPDQTEVLNKTA
mmetsp:Transcript_24931/g.38426  ORF Transcript_24931/g.38426 Transcript_24931/m.38426 type:complete len:354 (-) Transcript_24931:105-1166(-)